MANVLEFPASHRLIRCRTTDNEQFLIVPDKHPPPGSLISCFFEDLWLVAYYEPLASGFVRLVDRSGAVRLFEENTLYIEGYALNPGTTLPVLTIKSATGEGSSH